MVSAASFSSPTVALDATVKRALAAEPSTAPLPPSQRCAIARSSVAAPISSLPVALLEDVFSFLAVRADSAEALLPRGLDVVRFRHQLFTVQQVCHAWRARAQSLAGRYALHEIRIEAWFQVEDELASSLRMIHHRGGQATQLDMVYGRLQRQPCMMPSRQAAFSCRLMPNFAAIENRIVDWSDVFQVCSSLKRLDLSLMPFDAERLESILEAVSLQCPHLQSLILPTQCRDFPTEREMDNTNLLEILERVLPRWTASNGGLRLLSLAWYRFQSDDTKRKLLTMVNKHCPRIQYLRDWTMHPDFVRDDNARDYGGGHIFSLDIATWGLMMTQWFPRLVELKWYVPPDSSPYLEAFASSPKPHLKDLYLDYTTTMPHAQPAHEGVDAVTLGAFFSAIPNLRSFSFVTQWYHFLHLDAVTPHDSLLAAIAQHCPEIESIRLEVSMGGQLKRKVPMITDAGIHALARMSSLRRVSLCPVQVSQLGLTALLHACCVSDLHAIEIALYPMERELELMQRGLEFLIDENFEHAPPRRRPSFAVKIRQASSSKYRAHTRQAMDTLLTQVRQKFGDAGHTIYAAVTKENDRRGCEFELRVNLRKPEHHGCSREPWKMPIVTTHEKPSH